MVLQPQSCPPSEVALPARQTDGRRDKSSTHGQTGGAPGGLPSGQTVLQAPGPLPRTTRGTCLPLLRPLVPPPAPSAGHCQERAGGGTLQITKHHWQQAAHWLQGWRRTAHPGGLLSRGRKPTGSASPLTGSSHAQPPSGGGWGPQCLPGRKGMLGKVPQGPPQAACTQHALGVSPPLHNLRGAQDDRTGGKARPCSRLLVRQATPLPDHGEHQARSAGGSHRQTGKQRRHSGSTVTPFSLDSASLQAGGT